eukprot:TRINITY_DN41029_c0_g1_i2.p1 TRINITY_DN41029_c0_g1~~TRINITY_DN41029_c0_g1_i2.p1  ORF type:complete len:152 (-),score=10.71 TRINITY_DN41029_c0_g1_i2:129-584(-)
MLRSLVGSEMCIRDRYVLDLPERNAILFASRVFEGTLSPYYDRRYMEWSVRQTVGAQADMESHSEHPYTYRNPFITRQILTWATMRVSKTSASPSAWFERCCIFALPSLLKSNNTPLPSLWMMSTVFPHLSVLLRGNLRGLNVYRLSLIHI